MVLQQETEYDVIIASSSGARINGNREFFHRDPRVGEIHSLSSEKDCEVPEVQKTPSQEAILKALAIAWLLGIPTAYGPESFDVPFKPTKVALQVADAVRNPVLVVAGDTTQKVANQAESVFTAPDMFKLERDLAAAKARHATKRELKDIELQDMKDKKKLYTKDFAVLWRAGGAWLAGLEGESHGSFYDVEILALFKPLTYHELNQVYRKGIAPKIGPRVDLAGKASGEILLRDYQSGQTPDQGWVKISQPDLHQIIRKGIIPYTTPSSIMEFLAAGRTTDKRHLGFARQALVGAAVS